MTTLDTAKLRELLEGMVEPMARKLAAERMGLVKDKDGEKLPYELWSQAIPRARNFLNLE